MYYYEQTNCIQKDLSDIRAVIDRKEADEDCIRPVPKEKVGKRGRSHEEGESNADDEYSRSSHCQRGGE